MRNVGSSDNRTTDQLKDIRVVESLVKLNFFVRLKAFQKLLLLLFNLFEKSSKGHNKLKCVKWPHFERKGVRRIKCLYGLGYGIG